MKINILYRIILFISYAFVLFLQIAYVYFEEMPNYDLEPYTGYLALSSSGILLILVFSSKLNILPERKQFSIFPISYTNFLLYKMKFFLIKRYFIIILFLYIGFMFRTDFTDGFILFIFTICQHLFTILLYFVLWDILKIINLEKHINIIIFLSLFPVIFLKEVAYYKYLYFNPISNTISLPVYFFKTNNDILFFLSIVIISLLFYFIYVFLIKRVKQWI